LLIGKKKDHKTTAILIPNPTRRFVPKLIRKTYPRLVGFRPIKRFSSD